MNNNYINELVQSIGAISELWAITYYSFLKEGMESSIAISNTKAFMEIVLSVFVKGD